MDYDAPCLDTVFFMLTIYKQVVNILLLYIENYPIGIVTITNVRNCMQAVELLIKIWNKI